VKEDATSINLQEGSAVFAEKTALRTLEDGGIAEFSEITAHRYLGQKGGRRGKPEDQLNHLRLTGDKTL